MVELAIVLPVFLMMVLGAIDWGWFFVVQDAVSNAAREGARTAILGQDGAGRARTLLGTMLPAPRAALCTVSQAGVPNGFAVTATCPVGSLSGATAFPPFGAWIMPPTAAARVEMRL